MSPSLAGLRFPPAIVLLAVRWYLRYGLSYRDVEELRAERGIDVDQFLHPALQQRTEQIFAVAVVQVRQQVVGAGIIMAHLTGRQPALGSRLGRWRVRASIEGTKTTEGSEDE